MSCLSRRTAAERLKAEDGNILITVVLVSMLVGSLASLALTTGRQADWSSASDKNHEQALGVAEAGVHEVVSRISAQATAPPPSGRPNFWTMPVNTTLPSGCARGGACTKSKSDTQAETGYLAGSFSYGTPQGPYWFWVTRTPQGFVIDTQSKSGGSTLGRGRHIQVTLLPPKRFSGGTAYALFSYTSIELHNNDQVLDGDIFANDNITINNSNAEPTLRGSLTAARGWVRLDQSVHVTGNAWAGGPNYDQSPPWAILLGGGAKVDGWAKASNTAPSSTCADSNYNVPMDNGSRIGGDLTTLGDRTGPGVVVGVLHAHTCSAAAPAQALPTFTFNRNNYGPDSPALDTCPSSTNGVCEFTSVGNFQTWLSTHLSDFRGTFLVSDSAPSQSNRIDLTGATLTASATIITNAPVYTGNLDDSHVAGKAVFVLVSHYQPPTSTGCDTEHDTSDCAVHIKNNFTLNGDGTCKTSTLVYADKGPVAIKNGQTICGSVIADGILVKNGQTVQYDASIDRIVGFGPATYAIQQWKELPPT